MNISKSVFFGKPALLASAAVLAFLSTASAQLQTFDTPPVTGPTQAPGTWYTDRSAPAGFEQEFFDGDNRLKVTIDGADALSPANNFYNTQGRKFDTPAALSISADLYVDSAWQNLNEQMRVGLWGTGFNGPAVSAYPILSFGSANDVPGAAPSPFQFRAWSSDTGWTGLGQPAGFAFDNWYNLRIDLVGSAFNYYIDDTFMFTSSNGGSTEIGNIILQGYNQGEDYTVRWDNVNAGTFSAVPEPSTYGAIGAVLLLGLIVRRRLQAKKA